MARLPGRWLVEPGESAPLHFAGEDDGRNETNVAKQLAAPSTRCTESVRAHSVPRQRFRCKFYSTMLSNRNRRNPFKTKDRRNGYSTIFQGCESLFSNPQFQDLPFWARKRVSIKTRCFAPQLIQNKRRRPATSDNFSRLFSSRSRCPRSSRECVAVSATQRRRRELAARPFCRGSCGCLDRGPA